METLSTKQPVVDLRGAKTKEQERLDALRQSATQLNNDLSLRNSDLIFKESIDYKNGNALAVRGVERSEATRQSRNDRSAWNDVISGVFRMASIVAVVTASWIYMPTFAMSLAYFTDTEAGSASMSSGFIDLVASSSPEVTELECGGMADPEVYIETNGNPANVRASTTQTSGNVNLCDALELDVRQSGQTIYSGPLTGFYAGDIEDSTMRFVVSLASDAGPFSENAECGVKIEYTATQKRHGGDVGFSDTENVELAFSVDSESCDSGCEPCPCDCCGDLYVDVTNDNDGTITNDINVNTNTGGNDASGGDSGGDGGTIETGDTESEVEVETELNTNETTVINDCLPAVAGTEEGEEDCETENSEDEENEDVTCEEVSDDCNAQNEDENDVAQESDEEDFLGDVDMDTNESTDVVETEEPEENQEDTTSEEAMTDTEEMIDDIQNQIDEQMNGMLGS